MALRTRDKGMEGSIGAAHHPNTHSRNTSSREESFGYTIANPKQDHVRIERCISTMPGHESTRRLSRIEVWSIDLGSYRASKEPKGGLYVIGTSLS